MQPEQIMTFDHICHMSVQQDSPAVARLAQTIRSRLDVYTELQLANGYTDQVALLAQEADRQKYLRQSLNKDNETRYLV